MRLILKIILVTFLHSAISTIDYNKECTNAIRNIGLPRRWKNEFFEGFPLSYISTEVNHYHVDKLGVHIDIDINTRPMLSCLHQESPQLVQIIREDYLEKESVKSEYNFTGFTQDEFMRKPDILGDRQAMEVDHLVFKGKLKDGFFIEAGGHNFESQSTSLYFELNHNWTGLLVEPHPYYYDQGKHVHRNIYSINTGLSLLQRPAVMKYSFKTEMAGFESDGVGKVQCLPLYSMLLALDNPTVNYMSLDIEGGEFDVLQTLPWHKVDIEVMSIETHFLGIRTVKTLENLIDFLADKGYKHIPAAHETDTDVVFCLGDKKMNIKNDLFVRNDIAKTAGL